MTASSATISDCPYIIVAGAVKAATTSLFYYLSDHPETCPATVKETRFFLDRDYDMPSITRFDDGLDAYAGFFPSAPATHPRLEATPFYLYSAGCAERIRHALPRARIVVVLRDPVQRLVSHSHYLTQLGVRDPGQSFDEFVAAEFAAAQARPYPPPPLRMGRYTEFLEPFFAAFGAEAVDVIFFETLTADPATEVERLCTSLGLASGHYRDYDFRIYNPAASAASSGAAATLNRVRQSLVGHTYRYPRVHRALRAVQRRLEQLLIRDRPDDGPPAMTAATSDRLAEYYAGESAAIAALLGTEPPWRQPSAVG